MDIENFIKDFDEMAKKYHVHGLIICVGIPRPTDERVIDEATVAIGDEPYLERLLATAIQTNPILHRVVDNVVIVRKIEEDNQERLKN